jgi:nucleoid DNA-binding protein
MDSIFRHIETLLRRHDYVIVPEMGGFVYQYRPAVITSESIQPPLTTVSFNPLMKTSDGLLAIEISRSENISFREATASINQQVESLKSSLKSKKKVEIGNLGSLSIDDNRKIIFTPAVGKHLAPANYGLSTLHYAASTDKPENKVISFTLPSAKKVARYAAVAAVAVGLFFAAPKIGDSTKSLANLLPTEFFTQKTEVEQSVKPLIIGIPNSETKKMEAAAAENSDLKHHVIVSCMATQQGAEGLVSSLNKMNFTKAHILPPIKTYRVAIESFATKEEAIRYMQHLRANTPQFSDAWVLSE